MKKDLNSIILTRQELQIMKVVWERKEATVKEVWGVITLKKPTAYTTILTLMGILEDKGALDHLRAGRAYVYRPLLSQEQATRNQVEDLIRRFFDGKPEKLIETLVNTHLTEPEQIDNLKTLVQSRHQIA